MLQPIKQRWSLLSGCRDLAEILRYSTAPRRGIAPGFDEYQVIKALLLISAEEPLGRQKLSKLLQIGETSVRNLIRRLSERGVVAVDLVGGCTLTELGRKLVESFRSFARAISKVDELIKGEMKLDTYSYAAVFSVDVTSCINVLRLRDAAIRFGASSALVIRIEGGKTKLPPGDVGEDMYPDLRTLRVVLDMRDGESALVVFSSTQELAERAALLTALEACVACETR